jgi:hypothetical protein
MSWVEEEQKLKQLERIASALERIAEALGPAQAGGSDNLYERVAEVAHTLWSLDNKIELYTSEQDSAE